MFRYALLNLLAATLVSGHILITYPGSRGNNFITNETFPFGMQWHYPCESTTLISYWPKQNHSRRKRILTADEPGGGLPLSNNRTFWPTTGGALAFQPGWFSGHATAFLYVNIGLDSDGPDGGPLNWDNQLEDAWQLLGPSNGPYPGTLCLPDVKVPSDLGVKAGDNASIQIVELATHGASLFAVSLRALSYTNPFSSPVHIT